MPESEQHLKAKNRIVIILTALGWLIIQELPDPQITPLGFRSYQYDVHAKKNGVRLVVEVDGKVGHSSTYALWKGKFRDACSFINHKVFTVRIPTADIVGRKALSDEIIREEIEWQVEQKYGQKITL